MKFEPNPDNGKLDVVIPYSEAFECADIYPQDLQGMKDRAAHYEQSPNKAERRLAKNLSRAVLWIEREVYAKQNPSALAAQKAQGEMG